MALAWLSGLFSGCSSGPDPCNVTLNDQGWAEVRAKPRDINASVGPALALVDYTTLQRHEDEPGRIALDLINARGEPGELEIIITPALDTEAGRGEILRYESEAQSIRVRASLTRQGDAFVERELVCVIVERLEALLGAGDDPVPIKRR